MLEPSLALACTAMDCPITLPAAGLVSATTGGKAVTQNALGQAGATHRAPGVGVLKPDRLAAIPLGRDKGHLRTRAGQRRKWHANESLALRHAVLRGVDARQIEQH